MNDVQLIVVFALAIAVPLSALVWLITAYYYRRFLVDLEKQYNDELARQEQYYLIKLREARRVFDQDQP